jgi:Putative beta barrel porin-7 (BBP7)
MRTMRFARRASLAVYLCVAVCAAQVDAEGLLANGQGINLSAFGFEPEAEVHYAALGASDDVRCDLTPIAYSNEFGCLLCPCNYVWAEALILSRDNQAHNRPLVLDLNTNEVLLSTDDLDFDWDGGLRVGYCTCISDRWRIEFGYLGVFDQSASADVELADSLMLPGDLGLQVNNFFGADDVDVHYSSDLHSFESNLVRCCCYCDGPNHCQSIELLTGFRYIHFGEEFSLSSFDSQEGTTVYDVETENNLYGAQIGARYRACRGGWSWETTGKTGIYGNDMEQSQKPLVDFPNFVFRPGRSSDESDVSFVADLNFTAIYQLTRIWGLRSGYNLIWLEGVALAPEQLDFSNTPNSGKNLADGGGVFLHGVNIGLEARW